MQILCLVIAFLLFTGCASKTKTNSKNESGSVALEDDTSEFHNGRVLFNTCIPCHGNAAEGNANLKAPALVNQDEWYLKQQLKNFRSGIRGADAKDTLTSQMVTIAQSLTNLQTIDGLVSYLTSLPSVKTEKSIIGDVRKGSDAYNMICGACHGPGAEGNEDMNAPKLTGINDWYLKRQLENFKAGIRGSHANDKWGAQMISMAKTLKDEQAVNDVVAYIQSLQETKP